MLKTPFNIFEKAYDMYSPELRRRYAISQHRLLFAHIAGSHAYGMATESSDFDARGIFALDAKDYYHLGKKVVTNVSDYTRNEKGELKPKSDITFYSLRRFLELMQTANPNILEQLFMPEDCVLYSHVAMDYLIKNKREFVTQAAYDSHVKYAMAQVKKAKGTNKRVHNPQPVEAPKQSDFILFSSVGSVGQPFRPYPIKYMKERIGVSLDECNASSMEHSQNMYRVYKPLDPKNANGVIVNGVVACKSISIEEEEKCFIGLLIFNLEAYKRAHTEWEQYWEWSKNKNPNRWLSQEKKEVDFDCYLERETEFLTISGWKKFDEIGENDKLASLDENRNICYQKYDDRFDSKYTGEIFTHESRYSRFSVTPNHNLFVSDIHRSAKNKFSSKYSDDCANWHLQTVADYFSQKKSHKHSIISLNNINKDYDIEDDMIILIGLYLSEGSLQFSKKTKNNFF